MVKRKVTVLAVAVLGVIALAGCGSSSKTPPASDGGPTTPTSTPVTSAGAGRGYGY